VSTKAFLGMHVQPTVGAPFAYHSCLAFNLKLISLFIKDLHRVGILRDGYLSPINLLHRWVVDSDHKVRAASLLRDGALPEVCVEPVAPLPGGFSLNASEGLRPVVYKSREEVVGISYMLFKSFLVQL